MKNTASDAAESFQPRKLGQKSAERIVSDPSERRINPDEPDLRSPASTFDALCRMCGVTPGRDARIDFEGFVLAFEQLFNRGVQLEPESLDELRAAIGSDDEVSMGKWDAFHKRWLSASTMEAHLAGEVERRRVADELKRLTEEAAKREQEFEYRLTKAKEEAAVKALTSPQLLANQANKRKESRGAWFEQREDAVRRAAQYRSLDPENWIKVIDGVGGLNEALEEIRRRIWIPLCAPRQILDECELCCD